MYMYVNTQIKTKLTALIIADKDLVQPPSIVKNFAYERPFVLVATTFSNSLDGRLGELQL